MKKNQGGCQIQENNGYKVVNQYIEVINLQKNLTQTSLHNQKWQHPNKNNTKMYKKR